MVSRCRGITTSSPTCDDPSWAGLPILFEEEMRRRISHRIISAADRHFLVSVPSSVGFCVLLAVGVSIDCKKARPIF